MWFRLVFEHAVVQTQVIRGNIIDDQRPHAVLELMLARPLVEHGEIRKHPSPWRYVGQIGGVGDDTVSDVAAVKATHAAQPVHFSVDEAARLADNTRELC